MSVEKQFLRMGARVKVGVPSHWQRKKIAIDVRRDKEGEYFDVRCAEGMNPEVVDVRPELRHLVLMVRDGREKNKYLCGHDERHWFAAAVPGESVRSVKTAIEALRPTEVPRSKQVIRQGEWFFVPASSVPEIDGFVTRILRNEPLSRGGGSKPHVCEEMIRYGGTTVMVGLHHPTGISLEAYERLYEAAATGTRQARARFDHQRWTRMVRDAEVYVRGKVRHSDHATVNLMGWHRVYMNTERFAPHSVDIVFLD